jgi:hypothetical protein
MRRVVDTNVPIVANCRPDRSRGARRPSVECQLAAIDALENLMKRGRVVLDLAGDIQSEYHRYLYPRGQPGVGDRFYREVINSGERIERIDLARLPDGSYADFPTAPTLERFDPSDRKFAACARAATAKVAVTIERGWLTHREALAEHDIEVDFVCGCDRSAWFEE